jgi:P-type Ca2+ transporter type 2C
MPNLPSGLKGLSASEARERLRKFEPNLLARAPARSWLWEPLRTIADPMVLMLLGASGFYLMLGNAADAVVLMVAAVPLLAVDVLLEARARKALRALAGAVAPRARVVRDGKEVEVPTAEIVQGDLIALREGDLIFADGVVRWAANLALDESQLTGEAEPQEKAAATVLAEAESAAQRFYAGSQVVSGHGYGDVVATGAHTRYDGIARLVGEAAGGATPLERRTRRMARNLLLVATAVSAGVFALMMVRGRSLAAAFLYAITLEISAVPEEYPLVMALFLSLGAWRLGRIGVLVRRLSSVETLGSTTVICLDKTGTLTKGHYELERYAPLGTVSESELLEAAALACELNATDPIDQAIIAHCGDHGVDVARLHSQWRLAFDYPFEAVGKHMSHVWISSGAGDAVARGRIVAKGALEGILDHCALGPEERERVEAANVVLAEGGMRVLAVAEKFTTAGSHSSRIASAPERPNLDGSFTGVRNEDERGLRFCGLLGFRDPLRPEVRAAVAECQGAGVRLKLVTGDHALTAHAIAEAAGIIHEDGTILSGPELDEVSPNRLAEVARRTSIFARVRPDQKYAIVDALVAAGEVVAMTGDGVNDAPALRRANIGVAMGRRGTEVARAAAGIVLLEDDLTALVTTIAEGRRIFANIQRSFLFLAGFKTMIVSLALLAPALGLPVLLLVVQLVWLELVVHPVAALVFEDEPAPPDTMRRPPRPPSAPLMAPKAGLRSALTGLLLAAGALGLYASRLGLGAEYARSAAMVVVLAGSLMMAWAELAGARPWWKANLPRRARFWIVIVAVGASLPLCMWFAPLAALLHMAPIAPADWGLAALIVAAASGWRAFGRKPQVTQDKAQSGW